MRTLLAQLISLCWLLALSAGCTSTEAATEVIVVVRTDLELGSELDAIEVRVMERAELGNDAPPDRQYSLSEEPKEGQYALPLSFSVAPKNARQDFRIVVTGLRAGDVVVEQQAIASFIAQRSLVLELFLARSCLDRLCRDGEGQRTARACEQLSASCSEVEPSTKLPTWSGAGSEFKLDAGVAGPSEDGGDEPDMDADGVEGDARSADAAEKTDAMPTSNEASMDAAADLDAANAVTPDASDSQTPTSDAAIAMPAEDSSVGTIDAASFNGTASAGSQCSTPSLKACAGTNSTDALTCEAGIWKVRTTCDGDTRCDTRAGGTRGTCQTVIPECRGLEPKDGVCVNSSRFVCGDDLLSLVPAACNLPNTECYQGFCVCAQGYVPNQARTECVEADKPLQVAAGDFSCARLKSGRVSCWGANRFSRPELVESPSGGGEVLLGATDVAAGGTSACAVVEGGNVVCWGAGYAAAGTFMRPVYVVTESGSRLSDIKQVAVGNAHACAASNSGSAYCWGSNSLRQLGTGATAVSVAHAAPVVGLQGVGQLSEVRQIVTGALHTCALRTGAVVTCWGSNSSGPLGSAVAWPALPINVPGVGLVRRLSAGGFANGTCALLDSGGVQCWGGNTEGQLGTGNANPVPAPTAVLTAPNVPLGGIIEVALGYRAACARSAGAVSCWGLNDRGQLGQPPTTTQSLFARVTTTITKATALAQTDLDTHCVIDDVSQVLCWGAGTRYELGNDLKADSAAAVVVQAPLNWGN